MSEYSQPDFYRFNQDSLDLVKWSLRFVPQARSVLDLCAGCGVIGVEYALGTQVEQVTFLELQHEFIEHLERNIRLLPPHTKHEITNRSFAGWTPGERFDLILSNPPYYLEGHGEVGKDEKRNLSRSMSPVSWKLLLLLTENALLPKGNAFFITRNEKPIRDQIEASLKLVKLKHGMEILGKNLILSLQKI